MVYDYVFIGSGAAGMLLLEGMLKDVFFADKSILIVEKDAKNTNDRTWCFWENGIGRQEAYLTKDWSELLIGSADDHLSDAIEPYRYKMLRSLDFYAAIKKQMANAKELVQVQDEVLSTNEQENQVLIQGREEAYAGKWVFDSRFDYKALLKQQDYPVLQQHFLGWFVETEEEVFQEKRATFMDFSIPQKGNTRFMYVLPLSPRTALFEYTLFSAEPLAEKEYEEGIQAYLRAHYPGLKYQVVEKERGNIPMTCYPFWKKTSDRIIPIGIGGGWTKASTGYTFKRSERKSEELIAFLKRETSFKKFHKPDRFWFYDLLLLDILARKNEAGSRIFGQLFKKRPLVQVLRFLDEETHFGEELQIMASSPFTLFTGALLRNLYRSVHQVFSKSS